VLLDSSLSTATPANWQSSPEPAPVQEKNGALPSVSSEPPNCYAGFRPRAKPPILLTEEIVPRPPALGRADYKQANQDASVLAAQHHGIAREMTSGAEAPTAPAAAASSTKQTR
jgi:hypothetical protein